MFTIVNQIVNTENIISRCEDVCYYCDEPRDHCGTCDSQDWCVHTDS